MVRDDHARWGATAAVPGQTVREPGAGQARTDNPVHDKPAGDVFQFVGDILADAAQAPTAIGTGIGSRAESHLHPRDVVRVSR